MIHTNLVLKMEKKWTYTECLESLSLMIWVAKLKWIFVFNMTSCLIRAFFNELRDITCEECFDRQISTGAICILQTKRKNVNITFLEDRLKMSYSIVGCT